MQQITLNGTISISDTPSILNHMNYISTCLIDKKETSITNILDTIFKSTNTIDKIIGIDGTIYNNGHKIKCFGKLVFGKEDFKSPVDEYFVNGFPFERQILELEGKNLELTIQDLTDSIGEFIVDTTGTEDITHDTKSDAL